MRSGKLLVYLLAGLIFIVFTSCQNEKKDDDFAGVGRLVSSRNKARYAEADRVAKKENQSSKRKTTYKKDVVKSESKKDRLSSIVLYEEQVKILASKSGHTLANGVAYINKKGEIVKIKILKKQLK